MGLDIRRPPKVLPLDARRLVRAALAGAALLAVAHFVAVLAGSSGMVKSGLALVNLDEERSFGTWFSTVLLMINVALLVLLFAASTDRVARRRFAILAVAVAAVSADDIAGVHERIDTNLGRLLSTSGILTFVWIIPALLVVGLIAAACFPIVRIRPGGHLVAVGAAVFVLGAAGLESVGGWWFDAHGRDPGDTGYLLLAGVEESLEMLGCIIAMSGLLQMLSRFGFAHGWPEHRRRDMDVRLKSVDASHAHSRTDRRARPTRL